MIEQAAELVERDRLDEMRGEAGVLGALHVFIHAVAAQGDGGQRGVSGVDLPEKIKPAVVRQTEVADHGVKRSGGVEQLQGFRAGGGAVNLMAGTSQNPASTSRVES